MKTKPISIRFDEQDLLLAQNLSGIKKPQKLVDLLIAEYVKHLKGKAIELPKDYMKVQKIGILKQDGTVEEIKPNGSRTGAELETELAGLLSIPNPTNLTKKRILFVQNKIYELNKQLK